MQPTLTAFGNIRTETTFKTPTAFDHIKSRYWNKTATKSIHAAIRQHNKQRPFRQRYLLQAM